MARFHVYRLKREDGLVLVVQSDLLSSLQTLAVVPLLKQGLLSPVIGRLNPTFLIDGQLYTMATQFIGVVSINDISTGIADLTAYSDIITAAIDFLFQGF